MKTKVAVLPTIAAALTLTVLGSSSATSPRLGPNVQLHQVAQSVSDAHFHSNTSTSSTSSASVESTSTTTIVTTAGFPSLDPTKQASQDERVVASEDFDN